MGVIQTSCKNYVYQYIFPLVVKLLELLQKVTCLNYIKMIMRSN